MIELFSKLLRQHRGIQANPIYRIAVAVAGARLTWEQALREVRSVRVMAQVADGDLIQLDRQARFEANQNLEFGLLLSRLTVAAARAKGFERVYVDLSLNLVEMLQRAGYDEERDYYLGEALQAAQRVSYQSGYRRVLNRMARYASLEHNDLEARRYLAEQLAVGREDADTQEDVDTALLLAEMAMRDGDRTTAHDLFQRVTRSGRRLGLYTAVIEALLHQVSLVDDLGDTDGALRILRQAEELSERTVDPRLRARVALRGGELRIESREPTRAVEDFRIALQQARAEEDLALEARALRGLSSALRQTGDGEAAAQHLGELVALERHLGNRVEAAKATSDLAEVSIELGRLNEALSHLSEAREVAHLTGDRGLTIRVHGLLGTVLVAQGNERGALEAFDVAVNESRDAGDVDSELHWLLGAAETMLRFGGPREARPVVDRALRLARLADNELYKTHISGLRGQIALVEGRPQEATRAFSEATEQAQDLGRPDLALHYLPILARLAVETEEPELAASRMEEAIGIASGPWGDRRQLCLLHGQAGSLFRRQGDMERAIEHYQQAAVLASELEDERLRARALQGLATCCDVAGKLDQAVDHYRQAIEAGNGLQDPRAVARLHYNLGAVLVDLQRDAEARDHLNRAYTLADAEGDARTVIQADDLLRAIAPPRYTDEEFEDDLPIDEAPAPPRHLPD